MTDNDPRPEVTQDPTPDLTPDVVPEPAPSPATRQADDRPTPQLTGRERLIQALRTPWSRGQAVAAVLLALVGFAAAVQVRSNGQDDNFVGARQSDLIALINTLSLATDRAESDISELRETRDALRDDAEATRTALAVARRQTETLGILAGTVPAVGPGIRVVVESRSGEVGTDQLLNGLQELRNAGAEAIEINDEVRVVAQTGLTTTADAGLTVDGVQVQAPYVIEAIGDAQTLATALDFDGGFIVEVERLGGTVEVDRLDTVEITSVHAPVDMRFAEPVGEE
jgi:uncharacterized protein YlxW (UPF0749 family)